MAAITSRDRIPANGSSGGSTYQGSSDRIYSKDDIEQVARSLREEGKHAWSEVPRLYLVLRETSQTSEYSQSQLLDELLGFGVNDTWLPIVSIRILSRILPPLLHGRFYHAQKAICIQPSEYRLENQATHANFSTELSPPFEVLRKIGEGHIGEVEKVRSLTNNEVYARKSIRRGDVFRNTRGETQRFCRELQALGRINHRHCVKIIGSYTAPLHLAIIMSPVADCNLKEFFTQAENSIGTKLSLCLSSWFGCLATVVHYLHSNQIRHRDIKPANILVHGENILLVDFELSLDWKDLSISTTSTDLGCTPLYAAPEVILHNKRNSTSDIWSLGCVFLEMATVLKGKRVEEMREYFATQADNHYFFNNTRGISDWISLLGGLSAKDDEPLYWIPKMLQSDRHLRPRASEIVNLIRASTRVRGEDNSYFGKCCQVFHGEVETSPVAQHAAAVGSKRGCGQTVARRSRLTVKSKRELCIVCRRRYIHKTGLEDIRGVLCGKCDSASRYHVFRNSELTLGRSQVQQLVPLFHPPFMVDHLTIRCLNDFMGAIVLDNRWDTVGHEVRLQCSLPGRPLSITARKFYPSCHLSVVQKDPKSDDIAVDIKDSLSVGIYGESPEDMLPKISKYLENIVENHLLEYSSDILEKHQHSYSSHALDAIFQWFYIWSENLPRQELFLMKSAIKLLAINTIMTESLTLHEVPEVWQDYGPQQHPSNQPPRLINRQVKVALFLLQKALLDQVLRGLKRLAKAPNSWAVCTFLSVCLAFVLERIEAASWNRLYVSALINVEEPGTLSDIAQYCGVVDTIVFDEIYGILSRKIRSNSLKGGAVDSQLAEKLLDVKRNFAVDLQVASRSPLQFGESSRLVSALLDLIEYL